MQGVILAAGKGSRLHPLTLTRSKAMLPILGKPMVERVMEDLWTHGVDDFILVVSPDDMEIIRYFRRESELEADVRFVYQARRLGMADALKQAAPLIRDDFVLSACDNLVSAEHVRQLLKAWEAQPRPNAVLTLMPVESERLGNVGIVETDGPWVTRIVEKPAPEEAPSRISSLPLYLFSCRILDYLPEIQLSPRGEYELQDAIQMLIEREGRVKGVTTQSRLTLTSAADLLAINRHYLSHGDGHPQLAPYTVGPNTRLVTPLRIEAGAIIGAGCEIGPNVYIERGCRIGDGVTLRDTVMLRDSVVPDGAVRIDQVVS
ncbi:MAG: NTP transferase domain-containing protein [Anaerolineae bacterium]|nr:NTP transferase domain-containing protein [Anaerolineae bacterium]